jgi:hypothetical protein
VEFCGTDETLTCTSLCSHRNVEASIRQSFSRYEVEQATFQMSKNKSTEQHWWKLVDICVDESMSRWSGQGGHWIKHGLPQYVAIDRKPRTAAKSRTLRVVAAESCYV